MNIHAELTGLPASDGAWAISSIVVFVLAILFTAAFLLGVALFLYGIMRGGDGATVTGFFLGIGGLILGAIMVIVLWPFGAQYHQWREVSGTVSEVEARLLGDGNGGMSEMFVVRFEESGAPYRVDDSRGALVEEGDTLTILCRQVWEYQAADGQECRWSELVEAE